MPSEIVPGAAPDSAAANLTIEHDDQVYTVIAEQLAVLPDGRYVTLRTWRTNCPTCDRPFDFMRSALATTFQPRRRCPEHRNPGLDGRT